MRRASGELRLSPKNMRGFYSTKWNLVITLSIMTMIRRPQETKMRQEATEFMYKISPE
jgi:hypothetical protein